MEIKVVAKLGKKTLSRSFDMQEDISTSHDDSMLKSIVQGVIDEFKDIPQKVSVKINFDW
jgi:hypothetical protein